MEKRKLKTCLLLRAGWEAMIKEQRGLALWPCSEVDLANSVCVQDLWLEGVNFSVLRNLIFPLEETRVIIPKKAAVCLICNAFEIPCASLFNTDWCPDDSVPLCGKLCSLCSIFFLKIVYKALHVSRCLNEIRHGLYKNFQPQLFSLLSSLSSPGTSPSGSCLKEWRTCRYISPLICGILGAALSS